MVNSIEMYLTVFAVFIVGSGVVALYLRQQATQFSCPICHQKIPKDAIREAGVFCPHCDWSLVTLPNRCRDTSLHVASQLDDNGGVCSACGVDRLDQNMIRFWDGKVYCTNCIAEAGPELLQAARSQSEWSEEQKISTSRVFWRIFLMFEGGIVTLLGLPVLFVGLIGNPTMLESLQVILGISLFALPIVLLFAGVSLAVMRNNLLSVRLREGMLTLRIGQTWSKSAPIEDFEWFEGKLSQSEFPKLEISSERAILLVVPQEKSLESEPAESTKTEKYLAVGYDEKSRRIWESLLTLSGMSRRSDLEQTKSRLMRFLDAGGIVLVFPLSFIMGILIGYVSALVVGFLTGNEGVAMLAGGYLLIFGTIYVFCRVMNYLGEIDPESKQDKEKFSESCWTFRKLSLWLSIFISVGSLGFAGLRMNDRIIGAIIFTISGLLLGYDLDRRSNQLTNSESRENSSKEEEFT